MLPFFSKQLTSWMMCLQARTTAWTRHSSWNSCLAESPAELPHSHLQEAYSCMACLQERVEQLVPQLAEFALPEAADTARAAARLAMNDLATSTVTEMTALAGVFGRILAQRQGQVS